jgi:hypothetical protein
MVVAPYYPERIPEKQLNPTFMKSPRPLLLLQLLLLQFTLTAQVQWYQNQDGNNPPPNGTFASHVQNYNSSYFMACYQWQVINDQYSWKISKTHHNGTEVKTFFVDGTYAGAEMRVMKNSSVFVLKRDYPPGQDPVYTLYKLNSNLGMVAQRVISFPNNYLILNLNAFEIDGDGNVYIAGDGQYPNETGFGYASFVQKMNKNFVTKWTRMDSVQTSYNRLHVDDAQRVTIIEDYYETWPSLKVIRINASGTHAVKTTVLPDGGRFTLYSMLDRNDNLLLYGGKLVNDTTQAVYICKVARNNGEVVFRKTQFSAPGTQLNDMKMDKNGKLFSLVTLYYPDKQLTKISRMKPENGQLVWSKTLNYEVDSCQLGKLVMNDNDGFYAIGEKRCGSYFARGFAMRVKKSGQLDGNLPAPDSVAFQRYHSLVDGIIDNNQELIAIGNTNDFDTMTYSSTYYRAFAVRFDQNCNRPETVTAKAETAEAATDKSAGEKLQLYPNPVQHELIVTNIQADEYDNVSVYTMQGVMVLQQKVNASTARLDVSKLADGVYLLLFRSSHSLKERSVKFVIRK